MSRLDRIITGKVAEPPRIILYGDHGIGKSTFGASTSKPIFVVTEKGVNNLSVAKFPKANSWKDLKANLQALQSDPHDYKTVVLDSLDWTEKLIHEDVCSQHRVADISALPFGKGHSIALTYWRELVGLLDALHEKRRMVICCIAHSKIQRFDAPDSDSYDRYSLDLHAKAVALISQWSDCILYAAFKKYISSTDAGFGKTVNKAMGTGERVLYTEERPAWQAKNRYSLPPEMPLSWKELSRKIKDSIGDAEPPKEEETIFQGDDLPESMQVAQ